MDGGAVKRKSRNASASKTKAHTRKSGTQRVVVNRAQFNSLLQKTIVCGPLPQKDVTIAATKPRKIIEAIE